MQSENGNLRRCAAVGEEKFTRKHLNFLQGARSLKAGGKFRNKEISKSRNKQKIYYRKSEIVCRENESNSGRSDGKVNGN